ncbi:DeoR family transcriptional regulator [Escherichia coli]
MEARHRPVSQNM